mgnify:CR=1 FL=1
MGIARFGEPSLIIGGPAPARAPAPGAGGIMIGLGILILVRRTLFSWPGALGLLIGVIDNISALYVSAQYRSAMPLLLLIAIILLRPQGLLGTSEGRTV